MAGGGYEGIGDRFWNVGVVWDGKGKVEVVDDYEGDYDKWGERNKKVNWRDDFSGSFYIQGKEELVPFGERVPFRDFFEWLFPFLFEKELLRGDFEVWRWGRKTFVFHGGDRELRFGITLCWEVLFLASPMRWFSVDWDVIFNLTNDVWFGSVWGEAQHFWYSVLVARSLGVMLVRSSNFGISGVFVPSGKIKLKKTGEGFLVFSPELN